MSEAVATANGTGGASDPTPPASAEEGPAECIVHKIVPNALDGVWPTVKPIIRKSVKSSPITSRLETINDVQDKVYAGIYQLWVVFRGGEILAAAVTCLTEHARCMVLDVMYGAGEDLEEWLREIYETLDDEAVEQDCRFIRLDGRLGWEKPLAELGFEKTYVTFMKEV